MKNDIKNREDVYTLVSTFYSKVRKDALLGPIFEKHINDWELHFEHLTDFWETNLFFVRKYNGNPLEKHQEVDKQEGHTINEYHFGLWLNIWFETLDHLFEGEHATLAKNRARNMGSFLHIHMFKARNKDKD